MKKRDSLLTAVCVMLALLTWYSHADIFLRLEEYNGKTAVWLPYLNTALALGFSVLTAICVRYVREYKYVAGLAAFDSVAIFFHFQNSIPANVFNWIGSAYLGCLMFYLVSMIWKLADMQRANETTDNDSEEHTAEEPATETTEETTTIAAPIPMAISEGQVETVNVNGCDYTKVQLKNKINGMGHDTAQMFFEQMPDDSGLKMWVFETYQLRKGLRR